MSKVSLGGNPTGAGNADVSTVGVTNLSTTSVQIICRTGSNGSPQDNPTMCVLALCAKE